MVNNAADDPAGLSAGDKSISQLEELTVLDGTEMVPVIKQDEDGMEGWDNYRLSVNRQKMLLFIDQWNAAWGAYGRYDPDNAPDPEHPFMGNDIWLTYEEALLIDRESSGPNFITGYSHARCESRTFYPIHTSRGMFQNTSERSFAMCANLEVINFAGSPWVRLTDNTLLNCNKLKRIIHGKLAVVATGNVCITSPVIEELDFTEIKTNLIISASPLLSLNTVRSICNANMTASSPITVTVHPTVYAKITDETNTEWHALLDAAAAKNISFATV